MSRRDQATPLDAVLNSLRWFGPYQRTQFFMTMLPAIPCCFHAVSVVFIGKLVEHRCSEVRNLSSTSSYSPELSALLAIVGSNETQDNITVTYGSCTIDVTNGSDEILQTNCVAGYDYPGGREASFVSEWDLVCEQESLSDVSQTLLAVGMMAGALVFTGLADMYGRKPMYILANSLLLILGILNAFSPSFTVFAISRFILGALQQGTGLVSHVLLIELMPTNHRAMPVQVGYGLWSVAMVTVGLVCYLTRDLGWRYTQMILSLSSFYVIFLWCIVEESLRWLLANNRIQEANRIVSLAAKRNNVDLRTVLRIFEEEVLQEASTHQLHDVSTPNDLECHHPLEVTNGPTMDLNKMSSVAKTASDSFNDPVPPQLPEHDGGSAVEPILPNKRVSLSVFVKNKNVLIITVISTYMWFVDSMSYYGIVMMSGSLTSDLYLGFTLNAAVEIPAAVGFALLINRIGRKKCAFYSHLFGGLSLLSALILVNVNIAGNPLWKSILLTTLSLLGKFHIGLGFAVLYLYTPELFPTNLRNTGIGVTSTIARLGGVVAPYSRTFERHVTWGPGAVFAGLLLLVPVLLRYLPDTTGHELPQTLEELDIWFNKKANKGKKRTCSL